MSYTKSEFTNLDRMTERVTNSLDTVIKDGEIRAYFQGLRDAGVGYTESLRLAYSTFNVSIEQIKKSLYDKKT